MVKVFELAGGQEDCSRVMASLEECRMTREGIGSGVEIIP